MVKTRKTRRPRKARRNRTRKGGLFGTKKLLSANDPQYLADFVKCKTSGRFSRYTGTSSCYDLNTKYSSEYLLTNESAKTLKLLMLTNLVKYLSESANNRPPISYNYKNEYKIIVKAIANRFLVITKENNQSVVEEKQYVKNQNEVAHDAYDYLTPSDKLNYIRVILEVVAMYEGKDILALPQVHGRMKVLYGLIRLGPSYWGKNISGLSGSSLEASNQFIITEQSHGECKAGEVYCDYYILFKQAGVEENKMPPYMIERSGTSQPKLIEKEEDNVENRDTISDEIEHEEEMGLNKFEESEILKPLSEGTNDLDAPLPYEEETKPQVETPKEEPKVLKTKEYVPPDITTKELLDFIGNSKPMPCAYGPYAKKLLEEKKDCNKYSYNLRNYFNCSKVNKVSVCKEDEEFKKNLPDYVRKGTTGGTRRRRNTHRRKHSKRTRDHR